MATSGKRTAIKLAGGMVAAVLVLSGCAVEETSPPPRVPYPRVVAGPSPPPRVDPSQVPQTLRPGPLWTAPFTSPPRATSDAFVGTIAPSPREPALRIAAVDRHGNTRWQVRTNPSCTSFATTRAGGRELVVVLDLEPGEGTVARTTATAYDARDGSRAWGPVPVPGALRGPGLTFGDQGNALGGADPRVVLSAADGHVAVRERPGTVPRYEHDGVAIVDSSGALHAIDTAIGRQRWDETSLRKPLGAAPDARPELHDRSTNPGNVVLVEWSAGGRSNYAAYDIRNGALLGDVPIGGDSTQVVEEANGGLAALGGSPGQGTLTGLDLRVADTLWQRFASESAPSLSFAANGVVYGSTMGGSAALDERDGHVRARGDWEIPAAALAESTTLLAVSTGLDGGQTFAAFESR